MKICVIGGGLMGMALSWKLAAVGQTVTVLERENQLGGLATYCNYGRFYWDRFYHVVLPSDVHLLRFIKDIGLGDDLQWNRTYTGFFVDDQLYSISSNLEFLRFPLLPVTSKARLAWTLLYSSRLKDWRKLEKVGVEEWLTKVSGKNTFEKLWKPLLLAKLGNNYRRVSAVFIWSYIRRLFSARDSSASAEHLGHVKGGYKAIFDKLSSDIRNKGGDVRTGVSVSLIRAKNKDQLMVSCDGDVETYDKVVCTCPDTVLRKIVDPQLLEIGQQGGEIEYLGVVCVVLVTTKPITRFYIVNIADDTIPFTGVIGMSTVVRPSNTGNRYLTYLPKYMLSSDAQFEISDSEIVSSYLKGLKKLFPNYDSNIVESVHVNRAAKVQPLQVIDYSKFVPHTRTRHKNLFVLNTSQFVSATLNNNEVVAAVNKFIESANDV